MGEIVAWDMEAADVPWSKITESLTKAKLSQDFAGELTTHSAFRRACSLLKSERTIDKVRSKQGKMLFQFTSKQIDGDRVKFDYEATVGLDTHTGEVTCEENPELARLAKNLINDAMETRKATDITRMIQRMFESHADLYPISPKKGVAYFVPEKHRDFTDKVEAFMDAVGGSITRFPVPKGTKRGNKSVHAAVNAGLNSLVRELDEAVEQWGASTRESTIEKVRERYNQLDYKVEAYAEYLQESQEKLKSRLRASRRRVLERMEEVEDEKAAERETKTAS